MNGGERQGSPAAFLTATVLSGGVREGFLCQLSLSAGIDEVSPVMAEHHSSFAPSLILVLDGLIQQEGSSFP